MYRLIKDSKKKKEILEEDWKKEREVFIIDQVLEDGDLSNWNWNFDKREIIIYKGWLSQQILFSIGYKWYNIFCSKVDKKKKKK